MHFLRTLNTSGSPVGISTSCIRSVGILGEGREESREVRAWDEGSSEASAE